MQEGGKKETQRHLRLTSKNESSLLTHSVGANSQAHKVLSANLWLFCHQRGIHLVSMHDDDFKSYHSPLVEMKVAVGFFFFFNKQCDNTQMGSDGKSQRFLFWGFSSEACLAFANSFPQEIKSASLDKVSYRLSRATEHITSLRVGTQIPLHHQFLPAWSSCRFHSTQQRITCVRQRPASHRSPSPQFLSPHFLLQLSRPATWMARMSAWFCCGSSVWGHAVGSTWAKSEGHWGCERPWVLGRNRGRTSEGSGQLTGGRSRRSWIPGGATAWRQSAGGTFPERRHRWGTTPPVRKSTTLLSFALNRKDKMYLEICVTCWQAELSLRAVCPDMTNPPPPA